jgi:ribonuclease VapC
MDVVEQALIDGASISAVNLSEVASKLVDLGMDDASIRATISEIEFALESFDAEDAVSAGLLRRLTAGAGLALGDRACLTLATRLNLPALTADRAWQGLLPNVKVRTIR